MQLDKLFIELFTDYTLRNIALGSAILGVLSGVLGSFALLRRQSLLGDALAHAALPGVALAFLITSQVAPALAKEPAVLLFGAMVTGWLGAALVNVTVRNTRIKEDAAMGVVLSVFFGTGYVILSIMQNRAGSGQAGLDKYLFGSAASLIERDVRTMAVMAAGALFATWLLFKEFKLLAFDPDYLASLGFSVRWLDVILTTLLVIATVVGLQTVGVVLMSAMLIAPGVAARQWTNRLSHMIGIAVLIGVLSGVGGALISAQAARLPTGPVIVLLLTAAAIISFVFGTERGTLWAALRRRKVEASVRLETALETLYRVAQRHNDPGYATPLGMIGTSKARALRELAAQALVIRSGHDAWALTAAGYQQALHNAHNRDLWEIYREHQDEFGGTSLKDSADIARALPPNVVARLENMLRAGGD